MTESNPPSNEAPPPPPLIENPQPTAQPIGYASSGGDVYAGPAPDKDSMTMGMLIHLLGIFTGFIGPLIIWLIKKDTSPFVDDQGKEALNWHFTLLIAWIAGFVAYFICIGPFIHLAIFIVAIVFGIIGTMKANQGIAYRYPFRIQLIK